MASHNQIGIKGEALASDYFLKIGYTVLHKNWRHKRFEVDLIASKNNVLHFIEVKTRRTKNYGLPEDNVTNKKIQNLLNAAEAFLHINPEWKSIQFDILAITMPNNKPVEYFLIEDISL
jgi:putative endonuclease